MANILHRPDWFIPERLATPEKVFLQRRDFLRQMAAAGLGAAGLAAGGIEGFAAEAKPNGWPAKRNAEFNPGWSLTNERVASTYNNFYEFTLQKDVHKYVGKFTTTPWPIEITGLCENPVTIDAMELAAKFGVEERVYRFRCVEAWAMIVPWTGFQLSKLIEFAKPKAEAKFVRMLTASKPDQMPGIVRQPRYPWPYHEGLRLDEAMNPLTLMVTGVYGKPLAKQFGAPIRLIVPWKYGYKSIKSISRIEFVAEQPKTLWEELIPEEYPFESNVDPDVPHPRWSQATERMIDTGDRDRTQLYNGYSKQAASLYTRKTGKKG